MNPSSLEKVLKSNGHYAGDLVSLDFKSESLHKFLENVVTLVNQHSQRLNQLEIDKINIDRVKEGSQKVAESFKLPQAILNKLPTLHKKNKIETYEDAIEDITVNMKTSSNSFQNIFDDLRKKDDKLQHLDRQLGIFAREEDTAEKIRKCTNTCKKYTDDEVSKVLTRLKELEMKTNKKLAEFQNLTKETEKKTLWKINECESSLLKKITPQYVQKALEQLESKIHNDIRNNKNQELNELKFNLETVKGKVDALSRDVLEYEKENKMLLKDLEENSKTFEKRQKNEAQKRQIELKLKEILVKIDRLEKREDPQELDLRISKITNQHKEKLKSQNEKIAKLEGDLDSINNVMSSMGGGSAGGMDPHKLCQIDGEVRRLRDANRSNQTKLTALEDQLKTKLLLFEERIMTTLGMLKGQDNFVSREELYESLNRLREPVSDRLNENQNLISELNGKISKLQLFQKATKRKIKEMTRGDELNKILDMKMGVDQAETNFSAINMKLQNLEIIFNKVKMEVEANSGFLDELQREMGNPEQGINIIGPKQRVFPAKCLGCGFKHNPVHENNMMQGSDGKYYRVDLRNSYTADQRQVYGVTASQLAMYQTPGVHKNKNNNSATRPSSSKPRARPTSAHRLLQ